MICQLKGQQEFLLGVDNEDKTRFNPRLLKQDQWRRSSIEPNPKNSNIVPYHEKSILSAQVHKETSGRFGNQTSEAASVQNLQRMRFKDFIDAYQTSGMPPSALAVSASQGSQHRRTQSQVKSSKLNNNSLPASRLAAQVAERSSLMETSAPLFNHSGASGQIALADVVQNLAQTQENAQLNTTFHREFANAKSHHLLSKKQSTEAEQAFNKSQGNDSFDSNLKTQKLVDEVQQALMGTWSQQRQGAQPLQDVLNMEATGTFKHLLSDYQNHEYLVNDVEEATKLSQILHGHQDLTEPFIGPSKKILKLKRRLEKAKLQRRESIAREKQLQVAGRKNSKSSKSDSVSQKSVHSSEQGSVKGYKDKSIPILTGSSVAHMTNEKRFQPTSSQNWETGSLYTKELKAKSKERMQLLNNLKKSSFNPPYQSMHGSGMNVSDSASITSQSYHKMITQPAKKQQSSLNQLQKAKTSKAFYMYEQQHDRRRSQNPRSPLSQHKIASQNDIETGTKTILKSHAKGQDCINEKGDEEILKEDDDSIGDDFRLNSQGSDQEYLNHSMEALNIKQHRSSDKMNQVRLFKEAQDRKNLKAGQTELNTRRVMSQTNSMREKGKYSNSKNEAIAANEKLSNQSPYFLVTNRQEGPSGQPVIHAGGPLTKNVLEPMHEQHMLEKSDYIATTGLNSAKILAENSGGQNTSRTNSTVKKVQLMEEIGAMQQYGDLALADKISRQHSSKIVEGKKGGYGNISTQLRQPSSTIRQNVRSNDSESAEFNLEKRFDQQSILDTDEKKSEQQFADTLPNSKRGQSSCGQSKDLKSIEIKVKDPDYDDGRFKNVGIVGVKKLKSTSDEVITSVAKSSGELQDKQTNMYFAKGSVDSGDDSKPLSYFNRLEPMQYEHNNTLEVNKSLEVGTKEENSLVMVKIGDSTTDQGDVSHKVASQEEKSVKVMGGDSAEPQVTIKIDHSAKQMKEEQEHTELQGPSMDLSLEDQTPMSKTMGFSPKHPGMSTHDHYHNNHFTDSRLGNNSNEELLAIAKQPTTADLVNPNLLDYRRTVNTGNQRELKTQGQVRKSLGEGSIRTEFLSKRSMNGTLKDNKPGLVMGYNQNCNVTVDDTSSKEDEQMSVAVATLSDRKFVNNNTKVNKSLSPAPEQKNDSKNWNLRASIKKTQKTNQGGQTKAVPSSNQIGGVSAYRLPMAKGVGDLLPALEKDMMEAEPSFKNLSQLFKDKQRERFYAKNAEKAKKILSSSNLRYRKNSMPKIVRAEAALSIDNNQLILNLQTVQANGTGSDYQEPASAMNQGFQVEVDSMNKDLLAETNKPNLASERHKYNMTMRSRKGNFSQLSGREKNQLEMTQNGTRSLRPNLPSVRERNPGSRLSKQQKKLNALINMKYEIQKKTENSSLIHLNKADDTYADSSIESDNYLNQGSANRSTTKFFNQKKRQHQGHSNSQNIQHFPHNYQIGSKLFQTSMRLEEETSVDSQLRHQHNSTSLGVSIYSQRLLSEADLIKFQSNNQNNAGANAAELNQQQHSKQQVLQPLPPHSSRTHNLGTLPPTNPVNVAVHITNVKNKTAHTQSRSQYQIANGLNRRGKRQNQLILPISKSGLKGASQKQAQQRSNDSASRVQQNMTQYLNSSGGHGQTGRESLNVGAVQENNQLFDKTASVMGLPLASKASNLQPNVQISEYDPYPMNVATTYDGKRATFDLNRGSDTQKNNYETGSSFANEEHQQQTYNLYESRLGFTTNQAGGHSQGSYQNPRLTGDKSVNILLKPLHVVAKPKEDTQRLADSSFDGQSDQQLLTLPVPAHAVKASVKSRGGKSCSQLSQMQQKSSTGRQVVKGVAAKQASERQSIPLSQIPILIIDKEKNTHAQLKSYRQRQILIASQKRKSTQFNANLMI